MIWHHSLSPQRTLPVLLTLSESNSDASHMPFPLLKLLWARGATATLPHRRAGPVHHIRVRPLRPDAALSVAQGRGGGLRAYTTARCSSITRERVTDARQTARVRTECLATYCDDRTRMGYVGLAGTRRTSLDMALEVRERREAAISLLDYNECSF